MAESTNDQVVVLRAQDIATIIHGVGLDRLMDEMILAIRNAAGNLDPDVTMTMERAGFQYDKPDLGLVEWMPAMELGRTVAIKTVGYHPSNPIQRSIPSVLATTSLHDTSTGALQALVDSTLLTAMRTGAASAVATDILADPKSSVVGVVGAGAQAVTQIHAISRVRPIDRVLAYDTDPIVAGTLANRLPLTIPVDNVDDIGHLVGGSDIVCTATTVDIGGGPVMPDVVHRPHLHVNAVGSDFPGKTELPLSLLRRAMVVPDDTEQCLREGESQRLRADEIGPDLAQLVKTADAFEPARGRLTVFDSTGWSLEDLVAAELMIDHANRLGVGLRTNLQSLPDDPYSPYGTLLGVDQRD